MDGQWTGGVYFSHSMLEDTLCDSMLCTLIAHMQWSGGEIVSTWTGGSSFLEETCMHTCACTQCGDEIVSTWTRTASFLNLCCVLKHVCPEGMPLSRVPCSTEHLNALKISCLRMYVCPEDNGIKCYVLMISCPAMDIDSVSPKWSTDSQLCSLGDPLNELTSSCCRLLHPAGQS